jgi:hypothetical protein
MSPGGKPSTVMLGRASSELIGKNPRVFTGT